MCVVAVLVAVYTGIATRVVFQYGSLGLYRQYATMVSDNGRFRWDIWSVEDRWTSLMIASYYGRSDIILYEVKNGADINAWSNRGYTPLLVACRRRDACIINLLLASGANPVIGANGAFRFSALEQEASRAHYTRDVAILKLLVGSHFVDSEGEVMQAVLQQVPEDLKEDVWNASRQKVRE